MKNNKAGPDMTIDRKAIRNDIPGHHSYMNGLSVQAAAATPEEARRLVVGRDIALNGRISFCAHLVVEGVVEAETFEGGHLDVLESGVFAGTALVQDAVISGRFEGKITVLGRLMVRATGSLCGEIQYGALEVEAGARLEGRATMLPPPVMEEVQVPEEGSVAAALPEESSNNNVESLFGEQDETKDGPRVFRRAAAY